MSMTTSMLSDINELINSWPDFYTRADYYISVYLPEILANPQKCTMRERLLIDCIKDRRNLPARVREVYEQNITSKIRQNIESLLGKFDFQRADDLFEQHQTRVPDYESLRNSAWLAYVQGVKNQITEELSNYHFEAAHKRYLTIQEFYPSSIYDQLVTEYKQKKEKEDREKQIAGIIKQIGHLLEKYDFASADEKYKLVSGDYLWEKYQLEVNFYRRKQERVKLVANLQSAFRNSQFLTADQLFLGTDLLTKDEYIQLKSPWIRDYVQRHYGESINLEKAAALANPSQNLLLSARAGSGKTTVLGCKVSLLIDTEKVHPDQILVMAFNSTAADEIRNRIRQKFKQANFENARTFHSLASQLVQPEEDILYDDKEDVSTRKMTLFIQQLMKTEIKNPVFIEKMYEFFRKEMREIERAGFTLDDDSYFDYRRNMLQVALGGEKVKSKGEKIIADYLFEHDISYKYEKVWLWGNQIYRPDFSIYDQQSDFVIEHWGIDEFDPKKSVPKEWDQTWDEYYAEMQAKRSFWAGKEEPAILIETSIRDLYGGREVFEKILEERLAKAGISRPKLSRQALIQKIKDRDYTITKLAELFTQFIQKAKKQMLKAKDVQDLLQTYQPKDEREAAFIDLACRIYLIYEKALVRNKKIDFDDLMMRAIEKIHSTKGECAIWLGSPKSRPVKMNNLRWILLDEYQDFSQLFFELIKAIRRYNSTVRLYCVGDDWQAINGFAGSDLQYFTGFSTWVQDSSIATLATNFRSQAEIVKTGNQLMLGKGTPAQALPEKPGGDVHIEWMDATWIEMRNDETKASLKAEHERFIITELSTNGNEKKYIKVVASKYLKRCYEIITIPENIGKTVAILSRTNWIDGVRLSNFKKHLVSCFTQSELEKTPGLDKMIDVQTAHKYKGLQADLVIILNVTDGAFPLIHPDNALFEIFGKKLEDALAEEMRLFYVALTRATTSLYILTEKNRESSFLRRLDCYRSSDNRRLFSNKSAYASLYHSEFEEVPF